MKKRLLFHEIKPYLEHKNALVITGMRQVGKTTLTRQLFEEIGKKPKLWFDFDNPLDQKIFESDDYRVVYERLQKLAGVTKERLFVFLDEIQNFPEITKIIKYLLDHFGVKFIVTGSSNFYLRNLFPESLAGRKFLYELNPLSFREYLYFQDKLTLSEASEKKITAVLKDSLNYFRLKNFEVDFETYTQFGGFPEVATTNEQKTKLMILKNIFASFFEKDLRTLADYQDQKELRDLLLLLTPRVGSLLDISKIASELSITRAKIYGYLEFLQGTFVIKLLPKFTKSLDRSIAGGRKVYFSDTGILNILGKVNEAQVFENAVINQLARFGALSFYRKKTVEIDSILEQKIAFEIKLRGTENDLKRLRKIAGTLSLEQSFIVSKELSPEKEIISALGL